MNIRKLACVVLAILTFVGCNRSKTYSTPNGSVTVQEHGKNGSNVTVTGKNGEQVTINSEGGKIPDDYPKDVPVASNVKVILASSVNNNDEKGTTLLLESNDSLDHLTDFYKKGLAEAAWKIDTTMTQPEMTIIAAEKDNRQLSLNIQKSEGKCTISQNVAVKH